MRHLPTRAAAQGASFTVADFLEAGRRELELELVAGGADLNRTIEEPIVNRPGLALTGFFRHFAWRRLQLVGNAEMAYLDSLAAATRRARFQGLIDHKAFCFIYTNGRRPPADEVELAKAAGAVVMASKLPTRVFASRSAFVLERLGAPTTTIYGTMVEVGGLGVLFEGDPGLGKSETALGLIKRGSALVADDLTCVRKEIGTDILYGSAADSTAGFMEIRGIGIMHIPRIFGINAVRGEKQLQLIITFRKLQDVGGDIDRIGQDRKFVQVLGVNVPHVEIPVSEGRDLVNLVETAAQQQKLLLTGFDPVEALSERLRQRADTICKRRPTAVKGKGKRHG